MRLVPRRFTALVVFLVVVIPCPISKGQVRGYFPPSNDDVTVQDVSVVQLIAEPRRYDGKRVRFIGFLRIEFEGTAIYLHREDFDNSIYKNAVWVNIPAGMTTQQKKDVDMRYVICVGVFQAERHGHMGLFSGEVTDVRRLELWSDPSRPRRSP